jgi:hypothetical protein
VATGCGGLRLYPAVGEGCRRWRGTGSSNPSPSSGESPANPPPLSLVDLLKKADGHGRLMQCSGLPMSASRSADERI